MKSGIASLKQADEDRGRRGERGIDGVHERKREREREREGRVSNTVRAGTLMAKLFATVSVISS